MHSGHDHNCDHLRVRGPDGVQETGFGVAIAIAGVVPDGIHQDPNTATRICVVLSRALMASHSGCEGIRRKTYQLLL